MSKPIQKINPKSIDPIILLQNKVEKLENEITQLKRENKQFADLIKISNRSANSFKIELQRLTTRMNTNESHIRHLGSKR